MAGENAFTVILYLSDGKPKIKYGPEFSEDGYGFDFFVLSSKKYSL